MNDKKYDIFISYRREGGFETAKHIFDLLRLENYRVSFDIDTLRSGDFNKELLKRIDECTDFILILNPGVFDRCIDPNFDPAKDWLRNELSYALQKKKNIINVRLNGFTEFPDNLPEDIAQVVFKNGPKYSQDYFDAFYQRIKECMHTPVPEKDIPKPNLQDSVGAIIHVKTDIDCRTLKFGEEIGIARAGEDTVIRLRKGKHKLEFVSLENLDDRQSVVYSVEDNEMEDFLSVKLVPVREKRLEQEERIRCLNIPDEDIEDFEDFTGKMGFRVKSTGEILVASKYDNVGKFLEGFAAVKLNGKWGYIDKTGREVIPLKYDEAMDFFESLAAVALNGKYGYIDKTGQEVISLKYDDAMGFRERLAMVKLDGKWGFIDQTGREIIPLEYSWVYSFSEGLAMVELNDRWGYIDKMGREVIPLIYDEARGFSESLAKVALNGKVGFFDQEGREVIPLIYDDAFSFSEGLAAVALNGKWGYIDKTGREVIPLIYDEAGSFIEGRAEVKRGLLIKKRFYIDKNGNRVD